MVAPSSGAARRRGTGGGVITPTIRNKQSTPPPQQAAMNRLAAYEHLPRPMRSSLKKGGTTGGRRGFHNMGSEASSASLVSPANFINAVPRPKSPRRPDFSAARFNATSGRVSSSVSLNSRGTKRTPTTGPSTTNPVTGYFQRFRAKSVPPRRPTTGATPTLLAAQHFSNVPVPPPLTAPTTSSGTMSTSFDDVALSTPPRQGRRGQQQQPKRSALRPSTFCGGANNDDATNNNSNKPSPDRSCTTDDSYTSASTSWGSPTQTRGRQGQRRRLPKRRSRSAPPPRRDGMASSLLRGVIAGGLYGGAVVGSGITSCLVLTSDVYQQECGPHQSRSPDRLFLDPTATAEDEDETDDDTGIIDQSKTATSSSSQKTGNTTLSAATGRRSPTTESDATPRTPYRSNRQSDLSKQHYHQTARGRSPLPLLPGTTVTTAAAHKGYHRHEDSLDLLVTDPALARLTGAIPNHSSASRLVTNHQNSPPQDQANNNNAEGDTLRMFRLNMYQQGMSSLQQQQQPLLTAAQTPARPLLSPPPIVHRRPLTNDSPNTVNNNFAGPSYPPWRATDTHLRQELAQTRQSLQQARADLRKAQSSPVMASPATSVDERAMAALREREELLARISVLQAETTQLKQNLEQAQREASRSSSPQNRGRPPRSPSRSRGGTSTPSSSPQRSLADNMSEDGSEASSSRSSPPPTTRQKGYASGAVLSLVREVVKASSPTPQEEPVPSKSPVSVLHVGADDDTDTPTDEGVQTPPRRTSPTPQGSPFLSSQLISLKSELVDVRAQLAQAMAARVLAESQRDAAEEAHEQVQRETKQLRDEVNELKQLVLDLKASENEKEVRLRSRVTEMNHELSISRQLFDTEKRAKQRLEDELTETQNETDELRGQVSRFMKELETNKAESEQRVRVSETEAKRLQEEVRQMKEKLTQTNVEIVQQASEHLKTRKEIETQLEQSKATATALQRRVLFMDDQLLHAETESSELRHQVKTTSLSSSPDSPPRNSWRKLLGGYFSESISGPSSTGEDATAAPIDSSSDVPALEASVIGRLRETLDTNTRA